jgi:hypothetical protein
MAARHQRPENWNQNSTRPRLQHQVRRPGDKRAPPPPLDSASGRHGPYTPSPHHCWEENLCHVQDRCDLREGMKAPPRRGDNASDHHEPRTQGQSFRCLRRWEDEKAPQHREGSASDRREGCILPLPGQGATSVPGRSWLSCFRQEGRWAQKLPVGSASDHHEACSPHHRRQGTMWSSACCPCRSRCCRREDE